MKVTILAYTADRVSEFQQKIAIKEGKMLASLPHRLFCLDTDFATCSKCQTRREVAEYQVSTAGKSGSQKLASGEFDYDVFIEFLIQEAEVFWRSGITSTRLIDEICRVKKFSNYKHLERVEIINIIQTASILERDNESDNTR